MFYLSNIVKQNNVELDQDRRQQRQEAVPPYQTPRERSNNTSSRPLSLFLVFLAENWWRCKQQNPLSTDQFNTSVKHFALSSMIFSLKTATRSINSYPLKLFPQFSSIEFSLKYIHLNDHFSRMCSLSSLPWEFL